MSNERPCRNATDYEIARGLHFTDEDDGVCVTCESILRIFNAKRASAAADEAVEEQRERDQSAWARHPSNQNTTGDGD